MLEEKSFKVAADKELETKIILIKLQKPLELHPVSHRHTFSYQCYFYLSAASELHLTQCFFYLIPSRFKKGQRDTFMCSYTHEQIFDVQYIHPDLGKHIILISLC